MAAEAFDPFANFDDDEFVQDGAQSSPARRSAPPPIATSPRDAPRRISPRSSPRSSPRRNSSSAGSTSNGSNTDDIMKEFSTAFPSMTLNDDGFFPSNCFSATFDGEGDTKTKNTTQYQRNPVVGNLDGATFIIAEEMSVIHKSQTNQCSVKVRGNVSLEASSNALSQQISCDVSFLDPEGHLDTVASKNYDCAQPVASAFHISTEFSGFGSPLIEYTCGDKLRPVPMLINTTVHEHNIMFQLRVNPRNESSLLNAVVLVSVPDEFDGEKAVVNSVGRSIGKGNIDTNWSGITRILSWKLGELYSGAICEFEATFPPSDNIESSVQQQEMYGPTTDSKFPVLMRYESEGCLLSDVDLDFGDNGLKPSSMKRKFRVYHREI